MPARKVVAPDKEKKKRAGKKLAKLLDEVHEQIRQAGITPEEAERDALEMVRLFREKEYAKSKKSSQPS